jgi:predicted DCC family thiol-disulfide oxidoreductase YuxK
MGSPGEIDTGYKIILFDGVCNLCNGAVQFIIKHDKAGIFKFASLQSDFGQRQLIERQIDNASLHSIILIDHNHCLDRSNAVLEIARNLGGLWPMFYGFKIIPRFLRDFLYAAIARYRYRIFGKRNFCMIPGPEFQDKFLA